MNFGESNLTSHATFGSFNSTAYNGTLTKHAKNPSVLDGRWTLNMTFAQIGEIYFNRYESAFAIVDSGNPYITLSNRLFTGFLSIWKNSFFLKSYEVICVAEDGPCYT